MQPSGRTSTGAPIMTLEDQKRQQEQQAAAYQAFMAQQAAAQAQAQQAAAQPAANRMPFPGSNPQMGEPGLLARTYGAINDFFTPDKKLGEMVPASQNPLMAGPTEGIGGRARREQIEQAVEGKAPPRRR